MRAAFIILIIAALLAAPVLQAQQPPPQATPPGQQPAAPQPPPQQGTPGQQPPAGPQPQQGGTPAPPPGIPPTPEQLGGKPQPVAKSQEEFTAFQQAAGTEDLTAAEAAAADFQQKFPDSELDVLLYQNLLQRYQQTNNTEKTVEMGRKVLEVQPDNPTAAVTVATIISERTRETDLDRDEKLAEAERLASLSLQNVETGLLIPQGVDPARVTLAKQILRAMGHSVLGTVAMQRNNYANAEEHLRKAVEFSEAQPDAVLYLRLSVALDHLKRYPEALQAANRAVELAQEGPAAQLSRQQRDRLVKLVSSGGQPQQQQPPPTSPQPEKPQPPPTSPQPQY